MTLPLTILVALAILRRAAATLQRSDAAHRRRRARAGGAGRPDGAARRARAADHQEGAGRIADDAGQTARVVRAEPDRFAGSRSRSWSQTSRSTDAALRSEAIRSIGIGGDPKSLDALQEIYKPAMPT